MAYTDMREPAVYVDIEDVSYVEPTAESGRSVYSVILSDRGPCDTIVKVTSQQQFHSVFGTPNYLKTSQTHYMVDAALLYTGEAYVVRVVPDDASIANSYIKNTIKNNTISEDKLVHAKFIFTIGSKEITATVDEMQPTSKEELEKIKVGDWIFYADESVEDKGLSTSAQIVNINISGNGTYTFILNTEYQDGKTEDQGTITGNAYVYVPYEFSSMSDVTSDEMFVDSNGNVLYYFYSYGKGKYYNNLYIYGTRNTDLEKQFIYDDGTPMYPYMFMDIAVYEKQDNGSFKRLEGPWTVSLIPRYPNDQSRTVKHPSTGEYLYIDDVINDRSNLIRCVSSVKSEDGTINTDFPSITELMTAEDSEKRRLQVMLMLSAYTPLGTSNTPSGGVHLQNGGDGTGQYNTAGNIEPTETLLGKVGRAFNGQLTGTGIEEIREDLYPAYSPDYIIAGGYPATVQDNANELAAARQSCICLADTGGYKTSYDKDITARKEEVPWNSWTTMIYTQYRRIFDDYTGRYFWISPVYHAIQRHLYCDANYFIAEPVAGIEKGNIEEAITLAYKGNHTERGDLGDVELNLTIDEPDGKYIHTQYTAWKQYSALKRGHIAKFVAYLKKNIPTLLKDILHRKGTNYWVSQANTRVNSFLSKFLEGTTERYSVLRSFSCNVTFDDASSTLDVYLTVTPIRSIEKIRVTIAVA